MSKSLKKWEVCIPVYESMSTKNRLEAVVCFEGWMVDGTGRGLEADIISSYR